jgi:toxin ParE1/3/4
MSARKPRLALTQNAQRDFRNLLAYTERQWGKAQKRIYRQRFIETFAALPKFPEMGSVRPDLGPGTRVYRVGQHMVIYEPSEVEVLILRILHVRRAIDAEFDQSEA